MGDSMKQRVSAGESGEPLQKRSSVSSHKWKDGFIIALVNAWMEKQGEGSHGDTGLTTTQFNKLASMEPEEQEWKNAFLESLFAYRLIGNPHEVTLEETKNIISMKREDQREWRDKLVKQKFPLSKKTHHAEGENVETPQFRAARWDERTVSMELKMLPAVREAAKQIATAHGMTAQEYVQHLLVDSLNKNLHEVEEGKKRLEQFKGSTVAAKRYTQEEELARLRAVQQSKSSSRTPSR